MKERASWPMKDWEVRAILDGSKTQTRRVVRPQPPSNARSASVLSLSPHSTGEWSWFDDEAHRRAASVGELFRCPYGQPGDRLWVRETHAPQADCSLAWDNWMRGEKWTEKPIILYAADEDPAERIAHAKAMEFYRGAFVEKWRPSIHMPRWASRITLEITGVRVERLQDISESDAKAEGSSRSLNSIDSVRLGAVATYKDGYQQIWESINGPGSWAANPWVWVIEFKKLKEQP